MRCLLLGTSSFAIPTADVLLRSTVCTLVGVISKPDEPVGRAQTMTTPPLAVWAKTHDVRCWQPDTKGALAELLRDLQPDAVVVVAYGKIIPPDALTIPRFGYVNLHPSLLPTYRGPSPIHAAIANGDAETGVTLILLDADIDHGPVLAQERVPIATTATRIALERELAERGANLLERTLSEYLAGRSVPQEQDHERATTTPLLTRAHGRLDWQRPAVELERLVRAYEGWPGTWFTLPDGKRLKVLAATLGGPTRAPFGTIVRDDGHFRIACGDGTMLELADVQPEGGALMDGATFLRGYRGPLARIA
ncbi:methionyl-tRNA formyltransferase [Candidatus Uhrbacteria bacterium]|nr:methionyl-tRNA formyltransferase [Candidatus Uhrbacteria bacterium]